jgi:hypothetical protein
MTRLPFGTCLVMLIGLLSTPTPTLAQPGQTRPDYLKAYERGGFPAVTDPIEFSDARSFPPKLKGLVVDTDVKLDVRATQGADSSTDIRQRLAIATPIAFRDTRVQAAAGGRFIALGGGALDVKKGGNGADNGGVAVDFYNYEKNQAYRAIVVGERVSSLRVMPKGFQPKESRAEIKVAADIVARDPKHARAVGGLQARGLRAPPGENGDRLLYLLFYNGDVRPALYEATVNMSKARVEQAKSLRR